MSIEFSNIDPADGASMIGPRPFIRFSVTGSVMDPVSIGVINVFVDGAVAVVNGVAQPKFKFKATANSLFGWDIAVRADFPLTFSDAHNVKVTALGQEVEWEFMVVDGIGPRLLNMSPANGADGMTAFPLISFDISDVDGDVPLRTVHVESDVGSLSGSEITATDIDFRGMEGRLCEIDGNLATIAAVTTNDTAVTTYSGSGSGLNVKVFDVTGVDVVIDGVEVVKFGEVVDSGLWSTTVTTPVAGSVHVEARRINQPFDEGKVVSVDVRAKDDDVDVRNVSILSSSFVIGDSRGPSISELVPVPGSRLLADDEEIVFKVTDMDSGIDDSTLEVSINGVLAISSGTAVGDFATSSIVDIVGGVEVTLTKSTDWDSGEVVVYVSASDRVGNKMTPVTFTYNFIYAGREIDISVIDGQLVDDETIRVIGFDFSDSSFVDPVELLHTGYAFDGRWYQRGAMDSDVALASWASEASSVDRSTRLSFPVSGQIIVTSGSWSIVDAAGAMWMRCKALVSAGSGDWSGAGSPARTLADAAMARTRPLLSLACGKGVIVIDFTADAMHLTDIVGRSTGTGGVGQRNSNQSGGSVDTAFAMVDDDETSQVTAVTVLSDDSWVAAVGRGGRLEFTSNASDSDKALVSEARGLEVTGAMKTVAVAIDNVGSWKRVKMDHGDLSVVQKITACFEGESSSEAVVIVGDWLAIFAYLSPRYRQHTVSASPAKDVDQLTTEFNDWLIALATSVDVSIHKVEDNFEMSSVNDFDIVDLGLDSIADIAVSSVSVDKGSDLQSGHVYVSGISPVAGKIARFDFVPSGGSATEVATGARFSSVDVIGRMKSRESRYIRSSTRIS